MDRNLKTSEIAKIFNVSEVTVRNWVRRGVPHDSVGDRPSSRFNKDEVARWRDENKLDGRPGARKQDSSVTIEQARLRKELALAEKHEIAVKIQKGLLISVDEVRQERSSHATSVRNRFTGLASRIAPKFPDIAVSLHDAISEAVDDILRQLSHDGSTSKAD